MRKKTLWLVALLANIGGVMALESIESGRHLGINSSLQAAEDNQAIPDSLVRDGNNAADLFLRGYLQTAPGNVLNIVNFTCVNRGNISGVVLVVEFGTNNDGYNGKNPGWIEFKNDTEWVNTTINPQNTAASTINRSEFNVYNRGITNWSDVCNFGVYWKNTDTGAADNLGFDRIYLNVTYTDNDIVLESVANTTRVDLRRTSNVTIRSPINITSVNIVINVTGTSGGWTGNAFNLTSPSGTNYRWFPYIGFTTIDNSAIPGVAGMPTRFHYYYGWLNATNNVSTYKFELANGTWQMRFSNESNTNHVLNSWSLEVYGVNQTAVVAGNDCTPPVSGDWVIDDGSNCTLSTPATIVGNVKIVSGSLYLRARMFFSGLGRQLIINAGQWFGIDSTGGLG